MKVTVIEPEASGHRMILYVRHLAREVIKRGWRLQLITTQPATEHAAYKIVKSECVDKLITSIIPRVERLIGKPNPVNLLYHQFKQYKILSKHFRDNVTDFNQDIIYVFCLDDIDKIMSLLGSPFGHKPFAGLLMAIRFHHKRVGVKGVATRWDRLYEILFKRLLRIKSLKALNVIDEPLCEYAKTVKKYQYYSKIKYVPDAEAIVCNMEREGAREKN
jgi:hypothetical protein